MDVQYNSIPQATNLSAMKMKVFSRPGKGNTNVPCEKKVNDRNSSSPPTQGSPSVTHGPNIDSAACTRAPLGAQPVHPDVTM